jgi:hypothetical protein
VRDVVVLAAFAGAVVASTARLAVADEKGTAKVSFLEGKASRTPPGGAAAALAVGGTVVEGDTVATEAATRLELKMGDGSVVRVGPQSKLELRAAYFGAKGEKKFSAKLTFGRLWSKVTGLVGGDSKFEVETDNAVAGVRGTTFRVDAKTDRSVVVSVYAGSVAMASPAVPQQQHAATGRHQVGGPKQISKDQWEVLVGRMMRLAVGPDGKPGAAEAFTEEADAGDEWAAWNKTMDAKE